MTVRKVKPVLVVDLVKMLGGTVRGPGKEFKANVRHVELPNGWHDAIEVDDRAYPGGRCTFGGTVDMVLNQMAFSGHTATLSNRHGAWTFEATMKTHTRFGEGPTPSEAIWSWVRRNRRCA